MRNTKVNISNAFEIECDEVCFLNTLYQNEDYKKEVKKLKDTKHCKC